LSTFFAVGDVKKKVKEREEKVHKVTTMVDWGLISGTSLNCATSKNGMA